MEAGGLRTITTIGEVEGTSHVIANVHTFKTRWRMEQTISCYGETISKLPIKHPDMLGKFHHLG